MKTTFKEKARYIKGEFQNAAYNLQTGNVRAFETKTERAIAITLIVLLMIFLAGYVMTVFAAPGEPSEQVFQDAKDLFEGVYGDVVAIATPAAMCAAAIALVIAFVSPSADTTKTAMKWFWNILKYFALLMLLSALFTFIGNWASKFDS